VISIKRKMRVGLKRTLRITLLKNVGKRPLLTGDLQVTLKEGVGTVGELIFTGNSSWIRSWKFRLGLRVSLGFCQGIRIMEAKTEAFTVKDHRGECMFIYCAIIVRLFNTY
jgi:hypothetical protein